jgi:predicted Rossmann fold nucleotide-binding protein DprA/Smf involved in DNA uptake
MSAVGDRPYLNIGVTGSRTPPTPEQASRLIQMFQEWSKIYKLSLHHGNCVGVDEFAHTVAYVHPGSKIYVYPPVDTKFESTRSFAQVPDQFFQRKPYLERNKDIVRASDVLVAMPSGPERLRSGTWSTVRFALKRNVDTYIIMPDGSVDVRVDMSP